MTFHTKPISMLKILAELLELTQKRRFRGSTRCYVDGKTKQRLVEIRCEGPHVGKILSRPARVSITRPESIGAVFWEAAPWELFTQPEKERLRLVALRFLQKARKEAQF